MRELLPVLLILFGLLLLATAASVGVVWWLSGGGPSQQAAVILVYEVDPAAGIDPLGVDMQEVVRVLDRRINPNWTRRARITVDDDRRVEIGIFEDDPDVEQLIVDRVERVGSLELRVLAHFSVDGRLINRAMRSDATAVTDAAGQIEARWVQVAPGEEGQFQGDPEIAMREGRGGWEVLVLHDRFNVTGNHIQDASAAVDDQGNPCISFTLDSTGGQLLANLTGNHQPNFSTGVTRRLGVILGGRLHSAPAIQSTIHRQGMITGSFSEAETLQLSETLRGGPLPAPLKRVERRVSVSQP